ncbi:MAG: hypothetical protein KUG69_04950 [Marinosulfonomonas sp.]|nr:hypothetical protein [Marinosulfonomonas sp.]
MRKPYTVTIAILACLIALPSQSDDITIENVQAERRGGSWTFAVTLRHADTGWKHYADGWEIRTSSGDVLGRRELRHPHETEQPFTRSLSNVAIPAGTETVEIRAHCSVDGWVGKPFQVTLKP